MSDRGAVFHDPRGRKRRVTGGVALAVGAITSVLAVLFLISLISRPLLQKPPDPERAPLAISKKPSLLQTRQERRFLSALTRLKRAQQEQERRWKQRLAAHTGGSNVVGFYVTWDDASYSSLQRHISQLDWLVVEHLRIQAGDDPVMEIPDPNLSLEWARQANPGLKLFALINHRRVGAVLKGIQLRAIRNCSRQIKVFNKKRQMKIILDIVYQHGIRAEPQRTFLKQTHFLES